MLRRGRPFGRIGLAGLLGWTLFGRVALHPSVTAISDKSERGRVVNAAWRRYGVINALSLAADNALVVVNAALEQRQHRRPSLRRRIPGWGRT